MRQYTIFGNYGNGTIALLQWVIESNLSSKTSVISVDTGWAAPDWEERVNQAEIFARNHDIEVIRLKSPSNFSKLIINRNAFPDLKFQWCSAFLKGLPMMDYLNAHDPNNETIIVSPKVPFMARINQAMKEFIDQDLYFERKIWQPFYQITRSEWENLIKRTKQFSVLSHRALECDPCIVNDNRDMLRMKKSTIKQVQKLEKRVNRPMFSPKAYGGAQGIEAVIHYIKNTSSQEHQNNYYDNAMQGCGSHWFCGE